MKKWEIIHKFKIQSIRQAQDASSKFKVYELINFLLGNREIKTKEEREEFLNPQLELVTPKSVGIDLKELKKTIARINKAIEKKEQIVVFGDYDVDGITGTAILWETLYALGANVKPYIPHRVDEGYGLSITGIQNLEFKIQNVSLIITVDNGIVAQEAVTFANENKIDVIITDHHTIGESKPDAYAIVHTTKLCGAGVAYLLSKELKKSPQPPLLKGVSRRTGDLEDDTHLELAALGTVCDLVPLTGANRAIVTKGLERLSKTKRPGLQALFKQARIEQELLETYHIGFMIGPRLNAAGRMESAMDSLRLLCTKSKERAEMLAESLEAVNRERQIVMKKSVEDAVLRIKNQESIRQAQDKSAIKKLLFISHKDYKEGVIGLIAGKLVEAFYRPAIVLSIGEKYSKASVRSINGFDIIAFLRQHSDHFINVGGHPMAAGFTVETEKIALLQTALETTVESALDESLLIKSLRIDCELPLSLISKDLYESIQQFAPFGMGNPEPIFADRNVTVADMRVMGKEGNHIKIQFKIQNSEFRMLEAVGFGMGELAADLKVGDNIDVAYTIDENTWNGNTKLQLKLKDVRKI